MITWTPWRRPASSKVRVFAVASLALALVPASASAAFRVDRFTVTPSAGTAGADPTQAGGHPDLAVEQTFGFTDQMPTSYLLSDGHVRRLQVDLPPGVSGDPTGIPHCSPAVLEGGVTGGPGCPIASQVGVADIASEYQHTTPDSTDAARAAVFLMEPASDSETVRLGFLLVGLPVYVSISPRPGDLALRATIDGIPGGATAPWRAKLTLWGVPADASHDLDRLNPFGYPISYDDQGNPAPTASQAPRVPFITNPTSCTPPAPAVIHAVSHEDPSTVVSRTADVAYPTPTGCDKEPFSPSISVQPTDRRPDIPAGYAVGVSVPQQTAADSAVASHVRTVDLTLPPGVVLSPAGASGLQGCSDDQLALDADAPASCPDASRIGSAQFQVPILPGPIDGGVYLRTPQPGHLFRLVLLASGYGVRLKVTGEATPDPTTGQLHAVFDDAPQQPFSALELQFDGGPRAPLANPDTCGTFAATGQITGWNSSIVPVGDAMTISSDGQGAPCLPRSFAPAVRAGAGVSQAGASTSLIVEASRRDGEQNLGRLDVQLPPGVTAAVKTVPLCADSDANAGTCGTASLVGSAATGVGSGSQPVYLPGRVYLTSGYDGAPYGLSIVVPARVGPFDLGTVVVRAKVLVDRKTAALRVVSDALPTIIQGIPLRMKDIRISIDRPGFILNPTSCTAQTISATITSTEGSTAATSSPMQATGCRALPFRPTVTASTNGKRWKNSGASLAIAIKQPAGQSNLSQVAVRLPATLAARGTTISRNACLYPDWLAGRCAPATRSGTASALTPILAQPLTGNVYLVARPAGQKGLPQLRTVLQGNGLSIELAGDVTVGTDYRTTATFSNVPDVPISSFTMTLPQGPNSLLDANAPLCGSKPTTKTSLVGQNGIRRVQLVPVAVTGCKPTKTSTKTTKSGHASSSRIASRTRGQ